MPEAKKNTFFIYDENDKPIEYKVLFTYDSDETKKSYIAYTDDTKDQKGNIKVYASIYEPNEKKVDLIPINTKQEWKIIQNILNSIEDKIQTESNDVDGGNDNENI